MVPVEPRSKPGTSFQIFLGGGSCPQRQQKNFRAEGAKKIFPVFKKITPHIFDFSSDLMHFELIFSNFRASFDNFYFKKCFCPPQENPWGGQNVSWGGQLPPPRAPNDVPGGATVVYSFWETISSNMHVCEGGIRLENLDTMNKMLIFLTYA